MILKRLGGDYAIAQLDAEAVFPRWANGAGFVSISRTDEELSIVCLQSRIPEPVKQDRDWTCFKLQGPFAFDETGVVLSVIEPLSGNNIGVFVVSTFDGDHLLVKANDEERSIAHLTAAGHTVI